MKRRIMIRAVSVVLCFTLLALTPMATQQRAARYQGENPSSSIDAVLGSSLAVTPQQDEQPGVKVLASQVLAKSVAVSRLAGLIRSDEELQALSKQLTGQGYKAQTSPAKHFGWDVTFQRPDGQIAKVALLVQDYTKQGSKDTAAIGTITLTARKRSDTYSFSLIAPNGDFKNVIESRVDKKSLNVVKANSFWSCFVNRVRSKCAGICIAALGTCLTTAGGSWTSYLFCLASRCGLCAAKAFGCCLCDCSWWCSWAVGCCDR